MGLISVLLPPPELPVFAAEAAAERLVGQQTSIGDGHTATVRTAALEPDGRIRLTLEYEGEPHFLHIAVPQSWMLTPPIPPIFRLGVVDQHETTAD